MRDFMKRMERQITAWEEISAYHVSGKGPVFRIYQLLKINSENPTNKLENG